jgi:hypothetical protein
MPSTVNASASFVMFFAWSLGVALLTFGDKSPGNEVGNLYFGCWVAFVLCLFMVSSNIKDALAARGMAGATDDEDEDNVVVPSSSSLDTEKPDEPLNKQKTEGAEQAKDSQMIPKTPTTISFVKEDLEGPSDATTDPDAASGSHSDILTPDV